MKSCTVIQTVCGDLTGHGHTKLRIISAQKHNQCLIQQILHIFFGFFFSNLIDPLPPHSVSPIYYTPMLSVNHKARGRVPLWRPTPYLPWSAWEHPGGSKPLYRSRLSSVPKGPELEEIALKLGTISAGYRRCLILHYLSGLLKDVPMPVRHRNRHKEAVKHWKPVTHDQWSRKHTSLSVCLY